jgi:hypothetical protein
MVPLPINFKSWLTPSLPFLIAPTRPAARHLSGGGPLLSWRLLCSPVFVYSSRSDLLGTAPSGRCNPCLLVPQRLSSLSGLLPPVAVTHLGASYLHASLVSHTIFLLWWPFPLSSERVASRDHDTQPPIPYWGSGDRDSRGWSAWLSSP